MERKFTVDEKVRAMQRVVEQKIQMAEICQKINQQTESKKLLSQAKMIQDQILSEFRVGE